MKTVTTTLLLTLAVFLTESALAKPRVPKAKLLDMYAVREGDSYVVHIVADGDISEFLSDRAKGDRTYKLTIDVPALSPIDTKYDVETPFTQRFQVWPMQLGSKIYSRVQLELATSASSVVGVQNASHIFVRIQQEGASPGPTVIAAAPKIAAPPAAEPHSAEPLVTAPRTSEPRDDEEPDVAPRVAVTPLGILPIEPPSMEDSDGDEPPPPSEPVEFATDVSNEDTVISADEELFFNLFPTPTRSQQTLFNVAPPDDTFQSDSVRGIRVGRFALQPSVDASYIRGSNLLLQSQDSFNDNALMVRGRVVAQLVDSEHELRIAYEGRFRNFERFELVDRYTNLVDVSTKIATTPRTSLSLDNHFVYGAFESQEFDPGGEIVANTDLFYRNRSAGTFALEFSERLGGEFSGSFNRVEFLNSGAEFFDYDSTVLGGAVLYNLSPLTSLVGGYAHTRTEPGPGRPEASSSGDTFTFGIRGELTPLIRGHVRAGYATQRFEQSIASLSFTGFVADAHLTRQFGELTSLEFGAGRRTNPSAFQNNGFSVSNYGSARFVAPITERFQFTANAVLFDNRYPLDDFATGEKRNDRALAGVLGVSYFFTSMSFLSVDYRHDRRDSSLSQFDYRNNSVQFMIGFGFLNR